MSLYRNTNEYAVSCKRNSSWLAVTMLESVRYSTIESKGGLFVSVPSYVCIMLQWISVCWSGRFFCVDSAFRFRGISQINNWLYPSFAFSYLKKFVGKNKHKPHFIYLKLRLVRTLQKKTAERHRHKSYAIGDWNPKSLVYHKLRAPLSVWLNRFFGMVRNFQKLWRTRKHEGNIFVWGNSIQCAPYFLLRAFGKRDILELLIPSLFSAAFPVV